VRSIATHDRPRPERQTLLAMNIFFWETFGWAITYGSGRG